MQSPGPISLVARSLSEDQFSCSICLEVFVEPVSTPCGHTFCKACLEGYWTHSKKLLCPMCKKGYSRKPELCVNRVLAEISSQFQGLSAAAATPSLTPPRAGIEAGHGDADGGGGDFARAGEVACDACIGRKMRAAKSCLNCVGSFCESHLRQHRKGKALASHRLVEATARLEEKVCRKHERLLEAYCRTDRACVCGSCADGAHKAHEVVSADREWKKKMNHLSKRRSEVKNLIKERSKKLEEIQQSIRVIKSGAQKELEETWQVYAELQRLVEQSQVELVELIAARHREAERQAQDLCRGLEQELTQLRKKSSELDALAQCQDKVLFLQSIPTWPATLEPIDWSGATVNTDLYVGPIRLAVSSLVDKFQDELNKLHGKELKKLQTYATEVHLDPNTAQRNLVISDNGREVKYEERKHADHSKSDQARRFSPALFVLAREAFASGRHYWEVEMGRKTAWTVGVARASAQRKGDIKLSPDGGFWCLWLRNGELTALTGARAPLPLVTAPHKVGVFLDVEGGQVSFYDVKARAHLYTFVDTFAEILHPVFSPCPNTDGKNSAPLILTTVKHT